MEAEAWRWLVGTAFGIYGVITGYFAHLIDKNSDSIRQTQKDLSDHKEIVARDYARKDDIAEVRRKLDENTEKTVTGFANINQNISQLAISTARIEATIGTKKDSI